MSRGLLLTGAAGFIGFHLAESLLRAGWRVVGVDSLDDYYDVGLKRARLDQLRRHEGFSFHRVDIAQRELLEPLLSDTEVLVHLAAQVGVGFSRQEPMRYTHSNLTGFVSVLELCRRGGVEHLIYASSSSVYGAGGEGPSAETDPAVQPLSLYAATKRADELMAHAYGQLYGVRSTGLRFFTVYGPWGRPDMAIYRFARSLLRDEPLQVHHGGKVRRDFTYVDDVVEVLNRLIQPGLVPSVQAPSRILNLGPGSPVELLDLIATLERVTGHEAQIEFVETPAGDAPSTQADTRELERVTGLRPATPLEQGLRVFVAWLRAYEAGG